MGNNKVTITNYNLYKQIVTLKVNRPFHHSMMRPAADEYHVELKKYEFATPGYSLYINVTGDNLIENDSIQEKLYEQIFMPVQWIKTVKSMLSDGVDAFYEISPKSTLMSFINNISDGYAKVIDVQNEIINQL